MQTTLDPNERCTALPDDAESAHSCGLDGLEGLRKVVRLDEHRPIRNASLHFMRSMLAIGEAIGRYNVAHTSPLDIEAFEVFDQRGEGK